MILTKSKKQLCGYIILSLSMVFLTTSCTTQDKNKELLTHLSLEKIQEYQKLLGEVPELGLELKALNDKEILLVGLTEKVDGPYCYVLYDGEQRSKDQLIFANTQIHSLEEKISSQLSAHEEWKKKVMARKEKILSNDEEHYLKKMSLNACLQELLKKQQQKYELAIEEMKKKELQKNNKNGTLNGTLENGPSTEKMPQQQETEPTRQNKDLGHQPLNNKNNADAS